MWLILLFLPRCILLFILYIKNTTHKSLGTTGRDNSKYVWSEKVTAQKIDTSV